MAFISTKANKKPLENLRIFEGFVLILSIYLTNGFFLIILCLKNISFQLKKQLVKNGHTLKALELVGKALSATIKKGIIKVGGNPEFAQSCAVTGSGLYVVNEYTCAKRHALLAQAIEVQNVKASVSNQLMDTFPKGSKDWLEQQEVGLIAQNKINQLATKKEAVIGVVQEQAINVKELGLDIANLYGF